jgi:dephospho-CoA kinase
MLTGEGAVDRRRLGPVVFGDAAARRDLEAIVHPAVYRAIAAGIRAFELTGDAPLVVVDVPLLYETGRHADFDRVVATCCPPAMQVARLVARGLTEAEARQRLAAQLPAADKAARAHHVIRTDGTFEETDARVGAVVRLLLQ